MALMLITTAAFVVLSGIVLATYYTLTAESAVDRRLRELAPARAAAMERSRRDAQPSLLSRLLAGLGRYSMGGSGSGTESKLSQTLSAAGFRNPNATALFIGTR